MSLVQRDYILRLFEQMGQVIAVVIGLKKDGEPSQALQVMSESMQGLVGFNLEDAEKLSAEDLVQMVRISRSGHSSPGEMVAGQLGVVARILEETAEIYEMQGDPDRADRSRLKALHVYLVILVEERANVDDVRARVTPLLQRVSDYVLPFAISDLFWRFQEQHGDYAGAENTLFELLEATGADGGVANNGIAFYQRLLQKSDAELEAGGLPRDEVEAGLEEMKRLLEPA